MTTAWIVVGLTLVAVNVAIKPAAADEMSARVYQDFGKSIDQLRLSRDADDDKRLRDLGNRINSTTISSKDVDDLDFKEQRDLKCRLLLRLFSAIHERIDPTFVPGQDMPFLNISPPLGANAMESGVAPSAITDPVLRGQYEAAIQENTKKIRFQTTQGKFRNLSNTCVFLWIFVFSRSTFDLHDGGEHDHFEALIREEVTSEKSREALFEELEGLERFAN